MISIDETFEELLRLREASEEATESFKNFTHDAICEKIQEKINILGDSFIKYESISYIVQGPRDQGVDVLLKIQNNDEPEKYIGIQVKSHMEIEDRDNTLSKQLKSGYHDARNHYDERLRRYYILLCGDSKKHSKRISAITNEFSKESKVRVIGARHALNFITLSEQTIAAVVDTFLRKEDYVRSTARKEVIEYSPKELYLVLSCLSSVLENVTDNLDENFIYGNLESEFETKFQDNDFYTMFQNISESIFEIYSYETSLRFRVELFPGLRALYYDLKVRYEWPESEMLEHLYELLSFN